VERIRTFIAVDLPHPVRRSLGEFQEELKRARAAVSWVRPEQVHLTVKFLGSVASEQIGPIRQTLERVVTSASPLRLQPVGCGAFPSVPNMRVIWFGLEGDLARLAELVGEVEAALVPLGFKAEDRPFRPHLTLGRVKGKQNLRVLQQALAAHTAIRAEAFDVDQLVLYKSDLRPEGARYTPLFHAAFGSH
jgi:2'-5' RNA ligase